MPDSVQAALCTAIESFIDPNLGQSLGHAKALVGIEQHANFTLVRLKFGFPVEGYHDQLLEALRAHLRREGLSTSI